MATAIFGAGCFWGVELAFGRVKGVANTSVGYTGGATENPTYEQVCSDTTGHVEIVEIKFDPEKISYDRLVEVFFDIHDPTTLNRQGPDFGSQYRSAVFYHNSQQQIAAEQAKHALDDSGRYRNSIVTEVTAASSFFPAEEYHQRYFQKRGIAHH